jgi:hypothetical protein
MELFFLWGANEGLRRFGEQYYSSKPLISNSLELAEFVRGGEEFTYIKQI